MIVVSSGGFRARSGRISWLKKKIGRPKAPQMANCLVRIEMVRTDRRSRFDKPNELITAPNEAGY